MKTINKTNSNATGQNGLVGITLIENSVLPTEMMMHGMCCCCMH